MTLLDIIRDIRVHPLLSPIPMESAGRSDERVDGLLRQRPKITPPLDPDFQTGGAGHRAFAAEADSSGRAADADRPGTGGRFGISF